MDAVSDLAPSVFVFRETNGDPRRSQHMGGGSCKEGEGQRWSAEGEGAAVVSGG